MASISRVALLVAALLAADAARVNVKKALSFEASVLKRAGANGELICGGDDIWDMLTSSSSVKSIQNIKWSKIDSIAGDFLAEKGTQKEKLEVELAQLQARIKEKKAQEAPEKTTEDELSTLLEQSLTTFGPGGAKRAAETKCGQPAARPRADRNSYRDSKKLFVEKADQLLDENKRFDGETFLDLCRKMLPPEGEGNYCGPLCQHFKDKAQEISNSRAGEAGGLLSDELIETMMAKQMKLKMVTTDIQRCEKAQATLGAFQTQVGELKGVQAVRMDELMEAETALDDALYDLEDLSIMLEKEEDALVQADEAVTGEGAKVEAVKQEIAQAREQESATKAELTAGLKRLEDLRGELEAVKYATQMALDMKGALSAVMLKMRLFFEESALEPLTRMGVDGNLDNYFGESDKATAAASALGLAVDKLNDYCESEAQDVFAAVKHSVDLSELCKFGEPSTFKSESLNAVKEKERMFVSVLSEEVTGWLNPYHHNTGMTKEMAAKRTKEGEIAGFQEIIGVYSKTKFFRYLREWRKGGSIPTLILSLQTLTGELSKAVQEAEKFVQGLETQLAAVEQKRDKVIEDLQAAESELAKTADQQAQIAKVVQEMKDQSAAFKDNIEDLRERVRIAKENCQKADQALIDALEVVKAGWGKGSFLLEGLHAEKLRAENKVLLARRAVEKSQRALLDMESWASSRGERM